MKPLHFHVKFTAIRGNLCKLARLLKGGRNIWAKVVKFPSKFQRSNHLGQPVLELEIYSLHFSKHFGMRVRKLILFLFIKSYHTVNSWSSADHSPESYWLFNHHQDNENHGKITQEAFSNTQRVSEIYHALNTPQGFCPNCRQYSSDRWERLVGLVRTLKGTLKLALFAQVFPRGDRQGKKREISVVHIETSILKSPEHILKSPGCIARVSPAKRVLVSGCAILGLPVWSTLGTSFTGSWKCQLK